MNTQYFERLSEQSRLQVLDKTALKSVLKCECGLDCPAHSPKRFLVEAILEYKFGKELSDAQKPKTA